MDAQDVGPTWRGLFWRLALIMAVLRNGSNQTGLPTYMQEILIGVVIILAVGLDKLRKRQRAA